MAGRLPVCGSGASHGNRHATHTTNHVKGGNQFRQGCSLALLSATLFTACTRDVQAMNGQQIEERYGVSGAYGDTIATSDGPLKGTVVPITLADGRQGHLVIPDKQGMTLIPCIFATSKRCILYGSETMQVATR